MRAWFCVAVCCVMLSPTLARAAGAKRERHVTGPVATIYSDLFFLPETGDQGGMEVIIIPAGGRYWATVVIASGGTYDPVLVPLTTKGLHLEFTLPDLGPRGPPGQGSVFKGTVTAAGLVVDDGVNKPRLLRRQWRSRFDGNL